MSAASFYFERRLFFQNAFMNDLPSGLAAKRDRLLEILKGYGGCVVAFSGGLDSSVLAKAAQVALGAKATAVTGVSASLAATEREECERIAAKIDIRHEILQTGELESAAYRANDSMRCYHCKTDLFSRLFDRAKELGVAHVIDGSNFDDRNDYRPGMQAARDLRVESPLAECELTKEDLRALALHWDLPVWNKPASPCLSSRVAYGEEVTTERLAMIERAERILREQGISPLRVRYHRGDVARIECDPKFFNLFVEADFRREVAERFKEIGFKFVALDLEGFRSGSLNVLVK